MTTPQIIFVTFLGVLVLLLVLELVRRHLLREKYSALWILIALALVSVPWLYNFYVFLAGLVGIKSPTSFFFYSSIMLLLLLSVQFSLAASSAYYQRKRLAQEIALMDERLRRLERSAGTSLASPVLEDPRP
ncbi:MAG: DUF2304 domain-containing protein [Planctomycetota bacterium]